MRRLFSLCGFAIAALAIVALTIPPASLAAPMEVAQPVDVPALVVPEATPAPIAAPPIAGQRSTTFGDQHRPIRTSLTAASLEPEPIPWR